MFKRVSILAYLLIANISVANELEDWFTTAAGNNTGSTPDYPIEGMAPSTVNDTMRELMAVQARHYADSNGSITTAGAANTYTFAASAVVGALAEGQTYLIEINATNTGASTLNVDSTGARDIVLADGGALSGGELQAGGRYLVSYDAGRNDYTLVGGFSTYTLDKLDLSGTDAIDLVDTGNPLNIGSLAGTHMAFDGNDIQGKSTATAANPLIINRLGGDVSIGAQSGTGSVTFYEDGQVVGDFISPSFTIRGSLDNDPATGGDQDSRIELRNSSGTRSADYGFIGVGTDVTVQNKVHGGQIHIDGENTGGSDTRTASLDPDAGVRLNWAGALQLETTSTGARVDGTRLDIDSEADSNTRLYILNSIGGLELLNLTATGEIRFRQTSSAAAFEDNWMTFDRNAAVTLLHNNTEMARTATVGNGGLEVNNTVTGAGFERALTTSDILPANLPSATESAEGIIEIATAAEAAAGTSNVLALTPGRLAGTKSLVEDGYYVLPGGLVIQWGVESLNSNQTATFTYPRALTTYLAGGCSYEDGHISGDSTIGDACQYENVSPTQFKLTNGDNDGTNSVSWWTYGID